MKLTHFGHSCVLVEANGTTLLIDPGVYSAGFESLTGLDAILVTHQHPDHVDRDRLAALTRANPGATLVLEPETAALLEKPDSGLAAGSAAAIGSAEVTAHGGVHAPNHDKIPPLGNVGFLIQPQAGPSFFHPGDCYDAVPDHVDVLGLPLNAPWARMRETLAFLDAVRADIVIPIHDGLLSETGRAMYLMHVEKFGTGDVKDLPGISSLDL